MKTTGDLALYRRVMSIARLYRDHIACIFALSIPPVGLSLLALVSLKVLVDNLLGNALLPGFSALVLRSGFVGMPASLLWLLVTLPLFVALPNQVRVFAPGLASTGTCERLIMDVRGRLFRHARRTSLEHRNTKGDADQPNQHDPESAEARHTNHACTQENERNGRG